MSLSQIVQESCEQFNKFKNKCTCVNVKDKCSECPSEQEYKNFLISSQISLLEEIHKYTKESLGNKSLEGLAEYQAFEKLRNYLEEQIALIKKMV